jgi:type IV secretion system protein TrbL
VRAGTSLTSAAGTAYGLGAAASGESGLAGVSAGIGGVGRAGAGATVNTARVAGSHIADAFNEDVATGRSAAWRATGGSAASDAAPAPSSGVASELDAAPDWARRLRAEQARRAHLQSAAQAVREGDRPAGEAAPDLEQKD